MSRRQLLPGVGAVALLGAAGFALAVWLTRPAPGVSWENYRSLRAGMSTRDAEMLLGQPQEVFEWPEGWTTRYWRSEEIVMSLVFDAGPRLTYGKACSPGREHGPDPAEDLPTDQSLLDRIRRWLHW